MERGEKPKILGPKPTIASKPKYVPPVPLASEKLNKENVCRTGSFRSNTEQHRRIGSNEISVPYSCNKTKPGADQDYLVRKTANIYVQHPQVAKHGTSRPPKLPSPISDDHLDEKQLKEEYHRYIEKMERHHASTTYEWQGKASEKQPTSPSTVCCSILSSTANDCCGLILNTSGKEFHGKTLTHVESSDSNSSDSGGFKDFVQPDLTRPNPTHERKISQPDYMSCPKTFSHQRNASQPENISSSKPWQASKSTVSNAQALAQYLPQTAQHFVTKPTHERSEDFSQTIAKFNQQLQNSSSHKTEDIKSSNPRPISKTQFQQSTKKLEQLLAQGPDKERLMKYTGISIGDGDNRVDIEQKMKLQKQLQQKLQSDLQQTVKQIQEIRSLEIRLPQNQELVESNRSSTSGIGIQHHQKQWVSLF